MEEERKERRKGGKDDGWKERGEKQGGPYSCVGG